MFGYLLNLRWSLASDHSQINNALPNVNKFEPEVNEIIEIEEDKNDIIDIDSTELLQLPSEDQAQQSEQNFASTSEIMINELKNPPVIQELKELPNEADNSNPNNTCSEEETKGIMTLTDLNQCDVDTSENNQPLLEVEEINLAYRGHKHMYPKGKYSERRDVLYKNLIRATRRYSYLIFDTLANYFLLQEGV